MLKNPILAEMQEFASFSAGTQRYIRRSLDVGLKRGDALTLWARQKNEEAAIKTQMQVYAELDGLRKVLLEKPSRDFVKQLMIPLMSISIFDLGRCRLPTFEAYRFLYVRLLGPEVLPWLTSSFCSAAALPHLPAGNRKILLQSISEKVATATEWTSCKPSFFPEWVKKVPEMSI